MVKLILAKSHRFDSEIKINKKEILSIHLDTNNMIKSSKKINLRVRFNEDNIIKSSKKNNCQLIDKKDFYCIKMLDENFKKTQI